jgi:hypothetical protein
MSGSSDGAGSTGREKQPQKWCLPRSGIPDRGNAANTSERIVGYTYRGRSERAARRTSYESRVIRPEQRAVSEILRLFDRHAEAIPNLFACRSWTERFVRTLLWIREGATVMNS